jgi:hypothetical protein
MVMTAAAEPSFPTRRFLTRRFGRVVVDWLPSAAAFLSAGTLDVAVNEASFDAELDADVNFRNFSFEKEDGREQH